MPVKIINRDIHFPTPKNYSRKNFICTCLCNITTVENNKSIVLEQQIVKYELNLNKETVNKKDKKWDSFKYWGKFKEVIELPKIFDFLDEEDFQIELGHFTRDRVQIPFIYSIQILNIKKYENIKLREDRKSKLNNLKE